MQLTWYEEGFQKGYQEGLEIAYQGVRPFIQEMLEERFGPLSLEVQQRLQSWPRDRLRELGRSLVKAQSLREVGLTD